ncbi:hypothetical protein ACGFNU_20905 [Spirillospora sp. NPDC048911]|uniref:hypothetical protein n=1 Tax=Spirillospora sp. NPDC048911 TaxID=3364527 RepID=UPI00371321EF
MAAVTAERANLLIAGWDTFGEELRFVENAGGSTVHVVAGPGTPLWADNEPGRPMDFDGLVDLTMGAVYTVCGVRVRCNRGGPEEGGRLTDWFADDLLCRRCHTAFGDRADLIFECNRLPDPED